MFCHGVKLYDKRGKKLTKECWVCVGRVNALKCLEFVHDPIVRDLHIMLHHHTSTDLANKQKNVYMFALFHQCIALPSTVRSIVVFIFKQYMQHVLEFSIALGAAKYTNIYRLNWEREKKQQKYNNNKKLKQKQSTDEWTNERANQSNTTVK